MSAGGADDPWAPLVDRFVDGAYATVKGRVRTAVVHRQLLRHLGSPPGDILDVGGGAGHQSVPLARMGYRVTLLDPSPAMLERAGQRLAAEPAEVAARVRLVQGRGEDIAEATGGRTFDAVLCHGVLMYVDDPEPLVAALCAGAGPQAVVSVLALNAHAMAVRPALEGRWAEALAAFDTRVETGVLGAPTRADTVEELVDRLARHDVATEAWYGVWLFTDWLALAGAPGGASGVEGDGGDLAAVAAVEEEAGRRDPYRQLSRLVHVVGRRRG